MKILLPQKCKDVLFDPMGRKYRILYGGRGSGKSWSVARYLLVRSASENLRILCAREIQNSIKDSVYKLLVDQIHELALDNYFIVKADSIKSITGSEFIFKGIARNTSGIRSTEGIDICWCEEAESITEESWRILIPTIRQERAVIIITFNPDDERSATMVRFIEKENVSIDNPEFCRGFVNYWDNPWFPETLRKEMEWDKVNDPEVYEHIWGGRPKKYGNAVIFKDKVEIREFDTPHGVEFFYGLDFGFAQSPMALERCFMMESCLFIDYEAYGRGIEIDNHHAFLETVPQSHLWRITADSARPETINFLSGDYVDNKGGRHDAFNIVATEKGAGSIEDGISFLKKFQKIVIHPRCQGAIHDFKNYRWKTDKFSGEILPIPVDKANDAVDATRYALESWMKGGATIFDIL